MSTQYKNHPSGAKAFNKNPERVSWHDKALWFVREKRDKATHGIPEWEELREIASQIKAHTLSHLDKYLLQFEEQAKANGIHVHWAKDAKEHNEIVLSILQKHNVKNVVKSKSMLTEECGLNPHLNKYDIDVVDTDLGERIVQLAKEHPSHIVLPAIHKKKEEVGELFHEHLNTEKGATDPTYLTRAAREHLRDKFLKADAAITGVNFAVAESGGFVVCTNEGNVDMGANLAPVHIACMGIEKVIPKVEHLGIFLRLLARSATGQAITTYSSHFHKPKDGKEMHIVLVDNGRSEQLGRDDFRKSLNCIRCGACMNTCPIYRRSGGHSYTYTIPGPIGSILSPGKDLKKHSSLPFASTLCGSCSDVCPVKIDIHTQLYKWRQIIMEETNYDPAKKMSMKMAGKAMGNPKLFKMITKVGNTFLKGPRVLIYNPLNTWGLKRELPVPTQTFDDWYKKNNS
ncbi:LutB/LldF family L-lactate oxidation iron-sulfur protein [Flammeovirga sp. SJP92]|uniref:LutB/LldF family L-lactate oxidation iron-sulfur protein n=1 Tax=Flammeovirga sp. SJP92 TaxID=1775430 RepID=UPI000789A38A|nr:LutB/LldF family L-lactate oxidation iron-sulfur protein [Flammeovirga sp. SJP92]KXX68213.1 4Fe-4S ferredoxin [Flammeovirga sp. SJP92]